MEKLFIVIPAYNESINIRTCVDDWYPIVEKLNADSLGESRLVIIDDGSKDDTYQILTNLAKKRPYLCPLTKENEGHGPTILFGYRYAIDNGADYIFQTDSDGQTNPAEFEAFWNERNNFDAIIGERVVRGDGKSRKFVENTVCCILRIIFGKKVALKDANAPFRLMKSELVAKYMKKLPRDFNIPNIMFTTYFVYHGERVKFIPITFKPRQGGTNSINIRKIVQIGLKAIKDFIQFKKEIND